MERSLADFPSEVLAEITLHLHGFHILRMLYLTGSGTLWSKLQQGGVPHLELNNASTQESDLQRISTFQGVLSLRVAGHKMDPSVFCSLLKGLPKTLTKLHLIDSEHDTKYVPNQGPVYRVRAGDVPYNPSVPNLSELFPHLKDLTLRGVDLVSAWTPETVKTPEMTISFLNTLPRNLKSLHMYNLCDAELNYCAFLPPHLTKLTTANLAPKEFDFPMEPLPATLQDSLLDYTILVSKNGVIPALPSHITSLVCTGYWTRFFDAPLPFGLTSLTIPVGESWGNASFWDKFVAYLPPTLKTLRLPNQTSSFTDAAQWPSQLTDLQFKTEKSFMNCYSMPRSLKTLHLARLYYGNTFDLLSLPPSLETLHFDVPITCDADMQLLPKGLTRLAVTLRKPENHIEHWPPLLQSLHVLLADKYAWMMNEEAARALPLMLMHLPTSITHLKVANLPDYIVPHLPSSLVYLQMEYVTITGRISMNYDHRTPLDVAKIPSWLVFNPLPLCAMSTGASSPLYDPSLRQAFKSIRNRQLHAHMAPREIMFHTVVHLTHLPSSITALESTERIGLGKKIGLGIFAHLKSLVVHFTFDVSYLDMSQLTKLETLVLHMNKSAQTPRQLPPNLTDLELREMLGIWTMRLPTTLRRLNIPYIELQVLKPLNQLEVLVLGTVNIPRILQMAPTSVTDLSLNEIKSGEILPLLEVLPHLKRLKSRFTLRQVELDLLSTQKSGLELIGDIVLLEDFHTALH